MAARVSAISVAQKPKTWPRPIVHPKKTRIGQKVVVRLYRRIPRRGKLRVQFLGVNGKRVQVRARRKGLRRVTARIPRRTVRILRKRGGKAVASRLRVRIVGRGFRTRWSRRSRSPLVRPRSLPKPDTIVPKPTETPVPPQTPAIPESPDNSGKQVLGYSDFNYTGSFRFPMSACGWSTAWSSAGLAMRRVDGELRFFTGAHVYSGGLVYEVTYPGVSRDATSWPVARQVGESCDDYGGRKRIEGTPAPEVLTHGLVFDNEKQRLYWNFGDVYNGDASNDPVLGYTDYATSPAVARGPWSSSDGEAVHSQQLRGGSLAIPAAFADQYLDGRRFGIGFGGYYNIIGRGSMGPALFAISEPGSSTTGLNPVPLLSHPADVQYSDNWANRPTNYSIHSDLYWGRNPDGTRGYWAPGDTIEGASVWIDEPDRHGLIFFSELALGQISYGGGGLNDSGSAPYWHVYDPGDLAKVALGQKLPWQPTPKAITAVSYPKHDGATYEEGAEQRVTGAVYDSQTKRLFLLFLNGFNGGDEHHPVVHVYTLK